MKRCNWWKKNENIRMMTGVNRKGIIEKKYKLRNILRYRNKKWKLIIRKKKKVKGYARWVVIEEKEKKRRRRKKTNKKLQ